MSKIPSMSSWKSLRRPLNWWKSVKTLLIFFRSLVMALKFASLRRRYLTSCSIRCQMPAVSDARCQAEQWSPWECHATPTNGCRWYVWWSFSWASQLWWVSKIDFVAGLEKKIGNSKRILLQREVYVVRVHSMGGVGKQLRHWPSATRKRLKVYQLPSPDDVDALLLFCFRGLGHLWTSIQASVPPTIAEFYVYVIYCCVEFVNDYNMPGKDGYTCIH